MQLLDKDNLATENAAFVPELREPFDNPLSQRILAEMTEAEVPGREAIFLPTKNESLCNTS